MAIKISNSTIIDDSRNIVNAGIVTAQYYYGTLNGNAASATYATIAGYSTSSGISTYATSSGIATYATTAGVATALQNARNFSITGNFVTATAISFDGTGNVALAATIPLDAIGLGTYTTGDYVKNISGTSNQITVTGGTGEGSTPTLSIPTQFTAPQDVTVTRDLQVNRNLNVTGNITIGGTSATLFTTELKVSDPDLVLGFRTDGSGNDVSNDTTANHGGIAVASTEGTPLVSLYNPGIGESTLPTYKKIMWFKSGSFAGLNTDAWLINYAVGIGSTQFPSGTRLAAGSVQFTENDLAVVRNINASGIVTASSFSGNASSATYATNAGVSTYASTAGVSTSVIGGIGSVTQLRVSGVSTLGVSTFTGAVSFGSSAYFGDGDKLLLGDSGDLEIYHNGVNSLISDVGQGGLILDGSSVVYQASIGHQFTNTSLSRTYATFSGYTATFYYDNNVKFETLGAGVTITGTTFTNDLSVSGVTTSIGGFVGNLTGNSSTATYANTAGIATYASTAGISTYASTAGIATYATSSGIATYATTAGVSTSVIGGIGSITQLQVTGISTFTNGPILVGSAISTGTASQPLQVTGGAYVSGNIGIGTTNPGSKLTVNGAVQIQQDSGSNNRLIFRGQPGSSYRWNVDNYGSANDFRIFREDDATAANGVSLISISTTGTLTATKFSGDGSLLTGIIASGSGVVIQNQGSNVGTANTINFSTNLTASFSSGTATISLSNNPSISGILTADQVYTSNNGNGQNVRIGDDFWLGDVNVANTARFSGAQDSTNAFIIFGSSDAVALGRTGTGPLYYGGNFNAAGVVTATSFSGSGTNLTGIVTSITAGSGISVNQSTGNVTITSLDILEVMLFA